MDFGGLFKPTDIGNINDILKGGDIEGGLGAGAGGVLGGVASGIAVGVLDGTAKDAYDWATGGGGNGDIGDGTNYDFGDFDSLGPVDYGAFAPHGDVGDVIFPPLPGKPDDFGPLDPGKGPFIPDDPTKTGGGEVLPIPTGGDKEGGRQQGGGGGVGGSKSSGQGDTRTGQGDTRTGQGDLTGMGDPDVDPSGTETKTNRDDNDDEKKEEDDEDEEGPPGQKKEASAENHGSSTGRKLNVKPVNLSILKILKNIDKHQVMMSDLHDEVKHRMSNKADELIAKEVVNDSRENQITGRVDDYVKYHSYTVENDRYIINSDLEINKIDNYMSTLSTSAYDVGHLTDPKLIFHEVENDDEQKHIEYVNPLNAVLKPEVFI